jgi:hypothetical protein
VDDLKNRLDQDRTSPNQKSLLADRFDLSFPPVPNLFSTNRSRRAIAERHRMTLKCRAALIAYSGDFVAVMRSGFLTSADQVSGADQPKAHRLSD